MISSIVLAERCVVQEVPSHSGSHPWHLPSGQTDLKSEAKWAAARVLLLGRKTGGWGSREHGILGPHVSPHVKGAGNQGTQRWRHRPMVRDQGAIGGTGLRVWWTVEIVWTFLLLSTCSSEVDSA